MPTVLQFTFINYPNVQARSTNTLGMRVPLGIFAHYRLRVAHVVRDYGMQARAEEAPPYLRARHA